MSVDRMILAFAGFFVMFSLAMSHYHDPRWLYFTAFVGFNLFQSAFTGFCPLAKILIALGAKPSAGSCSE
ncbi:MAG: YgaP family membrane protein [bacterium]